MTKHKHPNRRHLLAAAAAATGLAALPARLAAQAAGPIKLGTLTPLTGAGGSYGPLMRDAVKGVIDAVNASGGVLGRQIALTSEDDQTNPEAAVRAARKLIDVDGVSAIIGTWASAVTTAVAPLCWQNKVALFTVSGADSVTKLPHLGYIFRTQPASTPQFHAAVRFMHQQGAKNLAYMGVQAPFAAGWIQSMGEYGKANNLGAWSLIYEGDKTTLRSEVDQLMRTNTDFMFLGGYATDTAVLLRDIFRAGYKGKMLAPAYAVNPKLIESLPAEVTDGVHVYEPWGAVDSGGYKRVAAIVKQAEVDPYTAQCYDHANLAVLAIAIAGAASGDALKDNVRKVTAAGGDKVDWAVDGLKALAAGRKITYTGASGPCVFDEIGDISGTQYRWSRIKDKKMETVAIS